MSSPLRVEKTEPAEATPAGAPGRKRGGVRRIVILSVLAILILVGRRLGVPDRRLLQAPRHHRRRADRRQHQPRPPPRLRLRAGGAGEGQPGGPSGRRAGQDRSRRPAGQGGPGAGRAAQRRGRGGGRRGRGGRRPLHRRRLAGEGGQQPGGRDRGPHPGRADRRRPRPLQATAEQGGDLPAAVRRREGGRRLRPRRRRGRPRHHRVVAGHGDVRRVPDRGRHAPGRRGPGPGGPAPGGARGRAAPALLRHAQGAGRRDRLEEGGRGGAVRPGRPAAARHRPREPGDLGERQLQGDPARQDAARARRPRSRWTPTPA